MNIEQSGKNQVVMPEDEWERLKVTIKNDTIQTKEQSANFRSALKALNGVETTASVVIGKLRVWEKTGSRIDTVFRDIELKARKNDNSKRP